MENGSLVTAPSASLRSVMPEIELPGWHGQPSLPNTARPLSWTQPMPPSWCMDAIPDCVRLALGERRHDGAFDHRAAVGAGAAIPAQALFLECREATGATVSPAPARPDVLARQACFRPVSEDGLSLIGAVPGIQGAYVATGHSV